MNSLSNPGLPKGEAGRLMLEKMNGGNHRELAHWGLLYFKAKRNADVLDIGCGGGANIARLLRICPEGSVTGVDYSKVSVDLSTEINKKEIEKDKVRVQRENVLDLSFEDESFDAATAFETIYFWGDLSKAFLEVYRVLRKDGIFFICNETDGESKEGYEWEKDIDIFKMYKIDEVLEYLKKAGFKEVSVERNHDKSWICFIARKNLTT